MMFFLPPPPPRYSTPLSYTAGVANGLPVSLIETTNSLTHPEGGCPLQVGEGTYELRDDVHLATPPPHPSEPLPTNQNPLVTAPSPPTSGVKVSPVIIAPRNNTPDLFRANTLESTQSDLRIMRESEHEGVRSSEASNSNCLSSATAPAFGEGTLALTTSQGRDAPGVKRRKPKSSIVKSTSTFISRVITSDHALKRLAERSPDGLYVFANINRAFHWLDFSAKNKQDPLAKILFMKAHMLSHDVNVVTKSVSHLDVIMGSSTGDIIWYEPMSQKYARINKNASINGSPVMHIKWIPGSENLFLAAHSDGCLMVYDKEKEDAPFSPEEPKGSSDSINKEAASRPALKILKSVNSQSQRANPVACWKISNHRINDFAFSPDRRHLAIVVEDGTLMIMDYLEERLLDVFTSYYGGIICVCWSPDGKYIVTGGQDDLVSIWSFTERKIVARCQGHNSWVSCVAFDPWRCDERNYRFGSVGDDRQLLLWDFSAAMLHRPKALQATARQRNSIAPSSRTRTDNNRAGRVRSNSTQTDSQPGRVDAGVTYHPVEPRAFTAHLPPILSKVIGEDRVAWIGFLEDSIMTSSHEGHIRTWDRPNEKISKENAEASTPEVD
ncbi:catabolite repression protein creC [Coccidioides immitis RS]|uniref:Catabolite repression protein creC n=3 Tax=Coccidioides immitis TaxID=5501 RepID=J3KIS4_COCIM|nr:catabolite repression protein creC [Coccidioides immitis RS]EAS35894.3 catabolite repression protein creC [Coccidioides immitis RS]KMP01184.1 catabolite repression protein creC [Coccidioides immitis RMSCC 2394]KMU74230.1 catabolite repression protein creC [Coccidioides immitis RMSCC 3703]TPX25913.1 hypothetical protein DIZ76_011370 [Coccidioides immitis]